MKNELMSVQEATELKEKKMFENGQLMKGLFGASVKMYIANKKVISLCNKFIRLSSNNKKTKRRIKNVK